MNRRFFWKALAAGVAGLGGAAMAKPKEPENPGDGIRVVDARGQPYRCVMRPERTEDGPPVVEFNGNDMKMMGSLTIGCPASLSFPREKRPVLTGIDAAWANPKNQKGPKPRRKGVRC